MDGVSVNAVDAVVLDVVRGLATRTSSCDGDFLVVVADAAVGIVRG
jgi:hypothetical protein